MIWPKFGSLLMDAAADDGAAGGGGDDKNKKPEGSTKIKIGDKEYEHSDIEASLNLVRSLQDPEIGREIVETMARKIGLLDKQGNVKEDLTEKQKESISKKILKKALGKDYEQFADKVGPAFDEIIEEYMGKKLGDIESRNSKVSWEGHVDKFTESHTMTPEIERTMRELMDDSPPNVKREGFNAQKYLTRMYNNAITELDITPPKRVNDKKRKSDDDGDDVPEIVFRDKPKGTISVKDAVAAAMKGIRFKSDD